MRLRVANPDEITVGEWLDEDAAAFEPGADVGERVVHTWMEQRPSRRGDISRTRRIQSDQIVHVLPLVTEAQTDPGQGPGSETGRLRGRQAARGGAPSSGVLVVG